MRRPGPPTQQTAGAQTARRTRPCTGRRRGPSPRCALGPLAAGALAGLLAGLLTGCDLLSWLDGDEVLILARRGDPTSRAIADYYAALRDVPEERILELSLAIDPRERVVSADAYRREIAAPIERHLRLADPDGEITTLVTTRGLPLLVEACDAKGCQRASLDAALAQLGRTSDERAFERVANPFFRASIPFSRFRRKHRDAPLRFLVARLTAPPAANAAPGEAPRLLRDALDGAPPAESASHLWRVVSATPRSERNAAAEALLDPIEQRLPRLGHRVCDRCPADEAGPRSSGLVLVDPTLDAVEYAERLAPPGVVVALGETRGESRDRGRAPFDRFVARWLARGGRALSLHLFDPRLSAVSRPDTQLAAWARGASAVEAHWSSVPLLGAGQVFVGDPLAALSAPEDGRAADDDRDGDGVPDADDNCPDDANTDQRDTNGDGFGNRCDADVDDDGRVETSDGAIYPMDARGDLEAITLTARNGPYDPHHDLDGDGRVDERDLVIARLALGRAPGR